jgi:Na+/H+-dicarboxylate symporters
MEKKKGPLGWYFNINLLYRILVGMIIGAILGIAFGDKILWLAPFGALFIRLLKMIVMPIIIATLIVGAASVSPVTLGKVGVRTVAFYLVTSALAVIIGLVMGAVFRPAADLTGYVLADAAGKAASELSISNTLLNIVPTNFFESVVKADVLPVIFFSILFGLGLSYLRVSKDEHFKVAGDLVFSFFEGVSEVMMKLVNGIMQYAPIGVLALIAEVFAKQGAKVVGSLGWVTVTCFTGYLVHLLLVYVGFLALFRLSPRRFWQEAKNTFITGLVTRSSYGTLPVNMKSAEALGIPKETYSFSLPLGATINMDGTAIYQGVCATFICLTATGHALTLSQMGIIVLTATLVSIGTAGVPGAGAIMLLMVLESVGLKVEAGTAIAAAYAMILGIDAILDMGRTALNVTGDLACTAVVSKTMGIMDMSKWELKKKGEAEEA